MSKNYLTDETLQQRILHSRVRHTRELEMRPYLDTEVSKFNIPKQRFDDSYAYMWAREISMNEHDDQNLAVLGSNGWMDVPIEDFPEYNFNKLRRVRRDD